MAMQPKIKRITMNDADFEIVGLSSFTNGRSCSLHAVCGLHVNPGDVLRLKATQVNINGESEPAIACVLVDRRVDTCTVAYVPRMMADQAMVKQHINKFVMVVELYNDSPSTYKRSKSHQNLGMASVTMLTEDGGRDE